MFSSPTPSFQTLSHYPQQSNAMILSTPPNQVPQRKRKYADPLPSTVLFAPSTFNRPIIKPKPRSANTKFGAMLTIPQDEAVEFSPAMLHKLTGQTYTQTKRLRREDSEGSAMSTEEDDQEDRMSVSSSPVAPSRTLPISIASQMETPQLRPNSAASKPAPKCHVCNRRTENRGAGGKLVVGLPVATECPSCQKATCSVCTRQCVSCETNMCGKCTVEKSGWELCRSCDERSRRRN
ncbi:hypothetical protein BJ508DRAFT_327178 [Ascobolus immersus RN42]|uniref:Uncharacterized protein n=1 Tax=Ascobolus immersus RN42 TaxID=1160509 RepID=A0A3N4I935_ASCIM|nr:hypothetical protein BJ508DRAFT_327178 [Ascobolus immersus RN42]